MEVPLLVQPAGRVEAEDPAASAAGRGEVVADEQRDDDEALHGLGEVLPDHGREAGRLGREGHRDALDLLEVVQLDLVEPHHVEGEADGAGEGDGRVVVGGVHLLQVALGDEVAHRGPAVPGYQHAVAVGEREHGGAVREPVRGHLDAGRERGRGGQQRRPVRGQELGEGRRPRREEGLARQARAVVPRHDSPSCVTRQYPSPT